MGELRRPGGELLAGGELTEIRAEQLETVKKAMQGDKESFSLLFMQTYQPMYRVVKGFLNRDEDVYDAMQNGYAKAYKYLSRLQAPEAFYTWLKKIMENAARDVRADIMGHEVAHEDMSEFADELSVEYADSSERRADIQDVLAQLDPRQAEVLTLHYYDGMKLTEIARMLHEPTSTVRSRLAAAKKTVLALFREKGIDRTLYGGSVAAILTCALRNAVGSSILSAVDAQDMLDHILTGQRKDSKEATALYRLLEEKRNRAIRRLASLLIVPTVSVALVAVLLVVMVGRIAAGRFPFVPADGAFAAASSAASVPDGSVEEDREASSDASLPSSPESSPPASSSGGDMPVTPGEEEGCFDRTLLSTPENFAAALNAAVDLHGDAVKDYTYTLDIQRYEGPTLNPATYTRLYSECWVSMVGVQDFVPMTTMFDEDFLARYSGNDEWYFYSVSNASGGIGVAVNNTTGELFMRGDPANISVMAPWQMYLVCQVLRPDLVEAGGNISFYGQVLNSLPLQYNARNGDGELLSEDSADFRREFANGYRLEREVGGYMVERFVYLTTVPTYTGENDRRSALGYFLYCAPKAQYQAFSRGEYVPDKLWESLCGEDSQLRNVETDRGNVPVNVDSRTQADGKYRFSLSVDACEALPEGTLPFTLTLSPYGDFASFGIDCTIKPPQGSDTDTLALDKKKWENTRIVWQGIVERNLVLGLLDEDNMRWLRDAIVYLTDMDNSGRCWYSPGGDLGNAGVVLVQDTQNGFSGKWSTDNDGNITVTDEMDLYFLRY